MFLNSAVETLSLFIADKTAGDVVPDEKLKAALRNFLNELFTLHNDPNDPSSHQKTFDAFMQQLTQISIKIYLLGLKKFSHIDTKSVAIACVYAAQIAAMRGLIKNKNAFRNTTYLNMFHRHFVPSPEKNIDRYHQERELPADWFKGVLDMFQTLNYDDKFLALHYCIGNGNLANIDFSVQDQYITEKNAYDETAFELAMRYNNPEMVHALLLAMHPEGMALLAVRMASLINDSGFGLEIRSSRLTVFFNTLFSSKILALSPASLDNLYYWAMQNTEQISSDHLEGIKAWARISPNIEFDVLPAEYNIKPRTSIGYMQLKNYEHDTSGARQNQLDCATSEIEDMLDILVTILDKLKKAETRVPFYDDKTFYETETDFNAHILCTVSFLIATNLIGHHTQDLPIPMPDLAKAHNDTFSDTISPHELNRWCNRTLHMLALFEPIQLAENDEEDEAFDEKAYGKVDKAKLEEWEATQSAATAAPFTPGKNGASENSTGRRPRKRICMIQ